MDDVDRTLEAIGALAEMLGFFYEKLLEQGFDEEQAIKLCKAWIRRIA